MKRSFTFPALLALLLLSAFYPGTTALGQVVSDAPFLEDEGLVVMEVESVPAPENWKFQTTEPGFTGAGYFRYTGVNSFNDPGNDIIEYNVVIENEGTYGMVMHMSHLGAPAGDQQNDVWTRMDDDEWFKTVHPSTRWNDGFTMHSLWTIRENGVETFETPTYFLTAGLHTFYISGRSSQARIDRIHFWKMDDPFKVPFAVSRDITLPESLRDANILSVAPNPIAMPAVAAGATGAPFEVTLSNAGNETINVSSLVLSGADAGDFSLSTSGPITVPSGGAGSVDLTFSPALQGTKNATLTITHDGLNSPLVVNVTGNATSGGSGTTILFRVNAGGPMIPDGAHPWEEDQTAIPGNASGTASPGTPHPFVNAAATGDRTFGRDDAVTLDATVPAGTPAALFQRGRWDPTSNPTMQWDIPIEEGMEIEVRLYFAEQLFLAPDSDQGVGGPRVFDVVIDGVLYPELDDFQIVAEAGHDVGTMRSYQIVSDGNVDIDFTNSSHDPIVQGIEILEVGGLSRAMDDGWNLVGVPVTPPNAGYATVFDDVAPVGEPFLWNGAVYAQTASLEPGVGYWIFVDAGAQAFAGPGVNSLSIDLQEGWNMIAGPGCILPVDAIDDPSNLIVDGTFFAYETNYQQATTLLPGFGYWVLSDGAGSIGMDCAPGKTSGATGGANPDVSRFGLLEVSDMTGASQALYFGAELDASEDPRFFSMPPPAPQGAFDVRFAGDTRLAQGAEAVVQLQSANYPMTVRLATLPEGTSAPITVQEMLLGEVIATHTLGQDQELVVTNANVTRLRVVSEATATSNESVETLPDGFALHGNYPNPFNPTTSVVFDLPEAGTVTVRVFDMLGRQVLAMPATALAAGSGHKVAVDASALPSGMYLYQVEAHMTSASVVRTGRMTLLK